ncbi:hypothetical protein K440DRAFT_636180 [Wilcoxina mikolae CBS 423.85]|nr:hypothetical protein K440DRAFT_636180 [Wilcoxina mikolae CBS 423.85]
MSLHYWLKLRVASMESQTSLDRCTSDRPHVTVLQVMSPCAFDYSIYQSEEGSIDKFQQRTVEDRFQDRRSLDIRRTEMSANNLAMNIGKFDGANYNKWSRQVELLLESKHVLGIVTGYLKKPEALAENASASERLAYVTLMESYVDKHGTARSTLLLTMEERLQLEYMKVKDAKELWEQLVLEDCGDVTTYTLCIDRLVQDWNLCIGADKASDTAENVGKPAVRKRNQVMVMPDGEHIFYLLDGILNNDDWKIFFEFMEDKDAKDTMWPSEVINKMLEHGQGQGQGQWQGQGQGQGQQRKWQV